IKPPSELPGAVPALLGYVFDTLLPGYPFSEPYEAIIRRHIGTRWSEQTLTILAFIPLMASSDTPFYHIQRTTFWTMISPPYFPHIKTFMKRLP
ncbi:MAG: hypothetical protein Q4G10_07750, partial [Bacteroidia bacterium]|nr:hypothetical protein [Bacteroidia bacterium]